MKIRNYLALGLGLAALGSVANANQAPGPACSDVPGWPYDVHGQHILNDYVVGPEYNVEWPPTGKELAEILAGSGAYHPGGPGIQDHPVAPGASFCTDSESPGTHF